MKLMRIAGAQVRNAVGDLAGNVRRLGDAMQWAESEAADVLVVPELALTGYPLADLVLHEAFIDEAEAALGELVGLSGRTTSVISTIARVPPQRAWDTRDRHVAIVAKLLHGGTVRGTYHKCLLPTYGIYDEGRNIAPGSRFDLVWRIGDAIAGVVICEDMWSDDGPPEAQAAGGAQVLLVPNASPYHRGRAAGRLRLAAQVARRNGVPLVYINFFGGQDDLVFDGGSLVVDGEGTLLHRCAAFAEDRFCIDVTLAEPRAITGRLTTVHTRPLPDRAPPTHRAPAALSDELTAVWRALVVATHDFTHKNHFDGAVLGLSGGIDSSVTAAVAADALGPEHVLAVAMPPAECPEHELRDARALAQNLGFELKVIPIDTIERALGDAVRSPLGGRTADATRRDLEAWARAAILSAFADEQNLLILTTANKSELSIGEVYRGDLVGGFAPLRDCPKTLLYELAHHRNTEREVVPEPVFSKRTTAQRIAPAPPPYDVLDPIVERYLEQDTGLEELVAAGYDRQIVEWVLRRIDDVELLRRQAPPGVRITPMAFDQDRRMPISNAWRSHTRQA